MVLEGFFLNKNVIIVKTKIIINKYIWIKYLFVKPGLDVMQYLPGGFYS